MKKGHAVACPYRISTTVIPARDRYLQLARVSVQLSQAAAYPCSGCYSLNNAKPEHPTKRMFYPARRS